MTLPPLLFGVTALAVSEGAGDMEGGRREDWSREVRRNPSAIEVARLANIHGLAVCCERWGWIHPRTLSSLIRGGRRQLERRAAR